MLFSALGVSVGLGLGLASGQGLGKWANGSVAADDGLTGEKIEQELARQIVDGRESSVTFDEFPYFLRYINIVCNLFKNVGANIILLMMFYI